MSHEVQPDHTPAAEVTAPRTLKQLRMDAGIPHVEQAARLASLERSTLDKLERGEIHNPRIGTVRALGRVYNVSIDVVEQAIRTTVMEAAAA
jgi:transcriptional regulator with XRE-family HTH domain